MCRSRARRGRRPAELWPRCVVCSAEIAYGGPACYGMCGTVLALPYCGTELAYGDGMCGTKVAYGDGMCGSEMAYDGGLGGTETAHGSHTKRGTEIAYGGQDLEDLLTLRLQVSELERAVEEAKEELASERQ
eukprot:1691875-Rhodomonas_salina.1